MKMLGNYLLAAVLVASPSLAKDVALHERAVSAPTVTYDAVQSARLTPYFAPNTPLLDWEKKERAQLINTHQRASRDTFEQRDRIYTPRDPEAAYARLRNDRFRLFSAPVSEVAKTLLSLDRGERATPSFSVGNNNRHLFSLMDSARLLDIMESYFTQRVTANMASASVDDKGGYYVAYMHDILHERGINVIAQFDDEGKTVLRDSMASMVLNFTYTGYDMDSGMVDFQTHAPVSVGTLLFKGCLCNNPNEPDELTVIVSGFAKDDLRFSELSHLVGPHAEHVYQSEKLTDIITRGKLSGASLFTDIGRFRAEAHDFIYLNPDTAFDRIKDVQHAKGVPEQMRNDVMGYYVNDIVHHELQHSRVTQETYRQGLKDHVNALQTRYRSHPDHFEHTLRALSTHAVFERRVFLEVNSDIYATGKSLQQWLRQATLSQPNKVDFINSVVALIAQVQSHKNSQSRVGIDSVARLKPHLFKSRAQLQAEGVSRSDINEIRRLSAQLDGASADEIDETFYLMLFREKNPYQSATGVTLLRDRILDDLPAFLALSETDLQKITHDLTVSLLRTPEYQAFMTSPLAYEVSSLSPSSAVTRVPDKKHSPVDSATTPVKGRDTVATPDYGELEP